MSTPRIPLSPAQNRSLQLTRDLGFEVVDLVASTLSAVSPPPLTSAELEARVFEIFGEDHSREGLSALIQTALSLAATKREVAISAEEVLEGVYNGLRTLPENVRWTEEELAKWDKVATAIKPLLDCEAVLTVTKFLELSYDYCRIWRNGKVLTDIRPVFNKDGTKINGVVVSYTLRVNFDDAEGCHNVTYALDEADILKLKEECERALIKAKTANAEMSKAGFPSSIAGTS